MDPSVRMLVGWQGMNARKKDCEIAILAQNGVRGAEEKQPLSTQACPDPAHSTLPPPATH